MASVEFELLGAFETHDADAIRRILDGGFDVHQPIKGQSIAASLTSMYTRSDRLPECLGVLLERGAVLDDPRLAPILLDDAEALDAELARDKLFLTHRTSMISTFTPLVGASLLHVAAEYGHANAARVLLAAGADVNARASIDEHGLNGHTPIFHAVNSAHNRSAPILKLLLEAGASPAVRLAGITWGKGFEWETTCFDVTPISYAQLGLLPQMHRDEGDVYANIALMLEAAGRAVPPFDNVPNRYLRS